MKVLLCPNFEKPSSRQCTAYAVQTLWELGLTPMLDSWFEPNLPPATHCHFGKFQDLLAEADVLLPIGGDGTIISTVPWAVAQDKPILGINAGRVGFLAQLERNEIPWLRRLAQGEYTVLPRMMLEVSAGNDSNQWHTAINDVVVRPSDWNKIVDIDVMQGKRLVASRRADGLIFATPTGSTAYSLSAGGPVVPPELSLIVLTAICPHSALAHTLILPAEEEYTITEKVVNNQTGLSISVDGVRVLHMQRGDSVRIRRSATTVKFIDLGLRDFYTNLNEKLSWRG